MNTLPPQHGQSDGHGAIVEALPEVEEKLKAHEFFVPAKNRHALLAYYLSIFGLIPGVGLVLGPVAQILGFMGLCQALIHPEIRGAYHAIFSILVGMIETILNWVPIVILVLVLLIVPSDFLAEFWRALSG